MQSLRELYRIGAGPSSSHTMAPQRAAVSFRARNSTARSFRVTLYGSLAATGRGHLTDVALKSALAPHALELVWKPETVLPFHPNGMDFEALAENGSTVSQWRVFSTGGGALREENAPLPASVYPEQKMAQMLAWCDDQAKPLWSLAEEREGAEIWTYLADIWQAMRNAIQRGLETEGVLSGGLKLRRKAREMWLKARGSTHAHDTGIPSAYALAVMEENASAGQVVTAPTCGACGAVPATLRYIQELANSPDSEVLKALAIAGLIGNLVKHNASISGAEVGCQGEVGTACAMAAGAAAYLLGGTARQIEYAAEMGLEHHLGLTCDPVLGLVQIPCIERNAFASTRAVAAAKYALLGDGLHRISFDEVVQTMKETGQALPSAYRETAQGGLANLFNKASHPM